jgi:hypothetical protein
MWILSFDIVVRVHTFRVPIEVMGLLWVLHSQIPDTKHANDILVKIFGDCANKILKIDEVTAGQQECCVRYDKAQRR